MSAISRRITPTGKIPGMGQKTERKLKRLRITNLPQVSIHLQARLKSHFGASGEVLQGSASGIYERGDYAGFIRVDCFNI